MECQRILPAVFLACSLLLNSCGKNDGNSNLDKTKLVLQDSKGQYFGLTSESVGPNPEISFSIPHGVNPQISTLTSSNQVPMAPLIPGLLPFDPSWGMNIAVYNKAVSYLQNHKDEFPNDRYIVMVDMGKHSNLKRFFLFDLKATTVEMHNVSHGYGSDPSHTGYAQYFSNVQDSHMTSLGVYKTLATFFWPVHGLSLRLQGLENTNDKALDRGILVHSANYVSDKSSYAGLSAGCLALDPNLSTNIINKIKDGAIIVVER